MPADNVNIFDPASLPVVVDPAVLDRLGSKGETWYLAQILAAILHGQVSGGGSGGAGSVVATVGFSKIASFFFNRPANVVPYVIGDTVADNLIGGNVTLLTFPAGRQNGGAGMIRRARMRLGNTVTANAEFRLHLFKAEFTADSGDGEPMNLDNAQADWIGSIDIADFVGFADGVAGVGAPTVGSEINFICPANSTLVWGSLEARGAYVPTSGDRIDLELEVIQTT